LYNHHAGPNSSMHDCLTYRPNDTAGVAPGEVRFTPYGWRAARSLHRGGVNASLADGATRFFHDDIELSAWQALATIQGGEVE
ncbi:MAG: DUF1559 domain-containing protein, partial [Planctomycetales bacterium]|nr:DUF1559 domain-containing protein [Planctomycetales bacterium]